MRVLTPKPPKSEHLNARKTPFMAVIQNKSVISPYLMRITLCAPEFSSWPEKCFGSHIKLFLPRLGQHQPLLPTMTPNGIQWNIPKNLRPITRTYSVRKLCRDRSTLNLECVTYHPGQASLWLQHANIGETIGIVGPGPKALFQPKFKNQYFIGDLSALPAFSSAIESLTSEHKVKALITVPDPQASLSIKAKAQLNLQWFYQSVPDHKPIIHYLKTFLPLNQVENCSYSIAGESSLVLEARKHIKARQSLLRAEHYLYAVPYWKQGNKEESYQKERIRLINNIL